MKTAFPIFLTLSLISFPVFAETIELKDGKIIMGEIVQETDDAVVIGKPGGGFIYSISKNRVFKIRPSTADEKKSAVILSRDPGAKTSSESEKKKLEKIKQYRLEKYEEEVQAAKKARGRIKIKFVGNRFGVVDTVLNGKTHAFLLADTGASMVVISREIANRLEIDTGETAARIRVVLANGSTATAIPITLDSVTVGSSTVKNVEAAISETPPGGGLDGLLGMTFLSNFHVKMDAKENCLVLEKY